ncbi:MAG: hydantoinase B/oxoprolinase family protein [Alphaproteobacteria bacterium]|nr:hydantoinase B/oxoprolinase family protein [Alphaproteobacteria bacterium]
MKRTAISPVDQAVITRSLLAAADEMGVKLIRSAHSPVVREAQDCSAAILDPSGRVVAQAELIPIQLGSITRTFRACLAFHPLDELADGDFLVNNDPYSGGQHLPDIFLFSPVFLDGDLIGVTATVVHHIDLGGGAPGLNPEAGDVHEEGIRLPPSRWSFERDWNGGPFERLIRANVRMPDATIGDLNAQFAANAVGGERLRELVRRYGRDTVVAAMNEVLDYSERRVRAAIAGAPDGLYHGEAWLDDDGAGQDPVPVRAAVRIAGDSIEVDFAGTAGQAASNINSPFASTVSSAVACIKAVLTDPDIPFNEGAERAVTVTAPYGSLVNPRPPAPVRARLLPSYRVVNAVMDALAQAVPDRVIAPGYDTTAVCCLSHRGEERVNIYLEIFGGGFGAGPGNDGCDGVDSMLSNCSNIPIEAMEIEYPFFRVDDYSLRPASGGAGQWRGGMGLQRVYSILCDGVTFATYGDRFRIAPKGLFGGLPGARAETLVERDGQCHALGSKQSFALRPGDRLIVRTGGGGGYGPPDRRDVAAASRDRADGVVEGNGEA